VDFSDFSVEDVVLPSTADAIQPLLFTLRFAHQTKQSIAAMASADGFKGSRASWLGMTLSFDVPLYLRESVALFTLYSGNTLSNACMVAESSMTIDIVSTEAPRKKVMHLRSTGECPFGLLFLVQTTFREPLREGSGGRPTSAFSRRTLGSNGSRPSSAVRFAPTTPPKRHDDSLGSGSSQAAQRLTDDVDISADEGLDEEFVVEDVSTTPPRDNRAEIPTTVRFEGQQSCDDGYDVDPFLTCFLDSIESKLSLTMTKALHPLLERLEQLDSRARQNEERAAGLILSCRPPAGSSRSPSQTTMLPCASSPSPTPTPLNAGSRPTSGDSNSRLVSFPDHASPLFTESQLLVKFNSYDTLQSGYIAMSQLVHFYRTHNSFAMDQTYDQIFDELATLVRDVEADRVSFNDFCSVALKLAKS
jgi:hypothetical protein